MFLGGAWLLDSEYFRERRRLLLGNLPLREADPFSERGGGYFWGSSIQSGRRTL